MMNIPARTRRRKIAAKVAKIVKDIEDENEDEESVYMDNMRYKTMKSDEQEMHFDEDDSEGDDSIESRCSSDETVLDCTMFGNDSALDFIDCSDWTARAVDSDIEEMSDDDNKASLRDRLANWGSTFNISRVALSHLLAVLHTDLPDFPKDGRTLLNTPRYIEITHVAGGDYYYFGVKYWLQILLDNFSPTSDHLLLHVNIDGIPLFNSSSVCAWPVLGSVQQIGGNVFPIAVFCSNRKPQSVHEYVHDFVSEMQELEMHGVSDNSGKLYSIELAAVICDAPARSFVKCIKGHSGYNCCERCIQRGKHVGKMLLPNLLAPLRSDASFVERSDLCHHSGISPLTTLNFGMVSGFPLDYMHLVCLGVMRRLLYLWVHAPKCKLSLGILSAVSARLATAYAYIPREFSRKPRALTEYKLWKATELRLFLLYVGPVVLKGFLSHDAYVNFLDLSVAVRILLCQPLMKDFLEYAGQLLKYFVQSFCTLYAEDQLVYNVHSLIHLVEDAKKFGPLDNVSSFKYENYLGRLKKLVRSAQKPCVQIVKRILESRDHLVIRGSKSSSNLQTFCKPHMEGPLFVGRSNCQQYKQYKGIHCFISTSTGDNCFAIGGKIGIVKNILRERMGQSDVGKLRMWCLKNLQLWNPFFLIQ